MQNLDLAKIHGKCLMEIFADFDRVLLCPIIHQPTLPCISYRQISSARLSPDSDDNSQKNFLVFIIFQTRSEDVSTMSGYNQALYPLDNFLYCLDQELLSRNVN